MPAAAAPLYALPPSRFVAARNELARTLAAKGDRAAAAVRKLPRPTGLAWVMNRLARERADEVEALLAAADRLRAGQRRALAGEGGDALRVAEEELRARTRALRGAAAAVLEEGGRRPDAAALARLELLLRVAASAPGPAREALRGGVLAREPEIASGDLSGFALLAGGGAAEPDEAPSRGTTRRRGAGAAPDRKVRAALAREERARERARRKEAEDLSRAEAGAARAEREAARAEDVARRAAERAATARARAAAAQAEARRLAERVRGGGERR